MNKVYIEAFLKKIEGWKRFVFKNIIDVILGSTLLA